MVAESELFFEKADRGTLCKSFGGCWTGAHSYISSGVQKSIQPNYAFALIAFSSMDAMFLMRFPCDGFISTASPLRD